MQQPYGKLTTSPGLIFLLITCYLLLAPFCPAENPHYGSLTSDGWWMRPADATYMEWYYSNLESSQFSSGIRVHLDLFVTNQIDGGSGYSTAVRVKVTNPVTLTEQIYEPVWLQNTLPGATTLVQSPPPAQITNTNPSNTMGYGYQASGEFLAPASLISSSGTLKVRVERLPTFDVQDAYGLWNPHVGDSFQEEGVWLTPAAGPPVNNPPIANAGADIAVEAPDSTSTTSVMLDGTGSSDPDGDSISFDWDLPGGGSSTSPNPTVSGLGLGSYSATLTVSDSTDSDMDTVNIDVVLHMPTATIDGLYLNSNPVDKVHQGCTEALSFEGTATDATHTISSYQWRSSLDGVLGNQAIISVNPSNDLSQGNHTIYFRATNDQGATSPEEQTPLVVSKNPEVKPVFSDASLVGGKFFYAQTEFVLKVIAQKLDLNNLSLQLSQTPVPSPPIPGSEPVGSLLAETLTLKTLRHEYMKWWDDYMCTLPIPIPGPYPFEEIRCTFLLEGQDESGWEFDLEYPDFPMESSLPYYQLRMKIPSPLKKALYDLAYSHWISTLTTPQTPWTMGVYEQHYNLWMKFAIQAHDPYWEDMDFQQVVPVNWPIGPRLTAGPVSPATLTGLYDRLGHGQFAAGILEAYFQTVPKLKGASAAADPISTRMHSTEALRYASWLKEEFDEMAGAAMQAQPLMAQATEGLVQDALDWLELNGFPPDIEQGLKDHGLTDPDIQNLLDAQVASDIVLDPTDDLSHAPGQAAKFIQGDIENVLPEGRLWVAVTTPRNGRCARDIVEIQAAISDKEPPVEWSQTPQVAAVTIDGSSVSSTLPYSWNTLAESEGVHTVQVDIQAASSGLGIASDIISVTVDNTPPAVSIVSPTSSEEYPADSVIPVTGAVDDEWDDSAAVVCILLDDQVSESPLTPPPGDHTLRLIAGDIAGNTSEASVLFTVEEPLSVKEWKRF